MIWIKQHPHIEHRSTERNFDFSRLSPSLSLRLESIARLRYLACMTRLYLPVLFGTVLYIDLVPRRPLVCALSINQKLVSVFEYSSNVSACWCVCVIEALLDPRSFASLKRGIRNTAYHRSLVLFEYDATLIVAHLEG